MRVVPEHIPESDAFFYSLNFLQTYTLLKIFVSSGSSSERFKLETQFNILPLFAGENNISRKVQSQG